MLELTVWIIILYIIHCRRRGERVVTEIRATIKASKQQIMIRRATQAKSQKCGFKHNTNR